MAEDTGSVSHTEELVGFAGGYIDLMGFAADLGIAEVVGQNLGSLFVANWAGRHPLLGRRRAGLEQVVQVDDIGMPVAADGKEGCSEEFVYAPL